MTQTTPERKPCGTCGEEYTVTAAGGMRHHFTENPAFQAGPDSRKCRGAGQPPAGSEAPGDAANGPQCRLCKHPVVLTENGRARSHLTPEQTPRPCPGGSDFPLGTYPDMVGTTDGLVATLRGDCEHVPVGQCYACYGENGKPISDAELAAMEEAQGTGAAPWGVNAESVGQPTMAEQLRNVETDDFGRPVRECFNCDRVGCKGCGDPVADDSRPEASRFIELLAKETQGAGTVLDRLKTDPMREAADAQTSELDHRHLDSSGVEWVHPGPRETCPTPECETWRRIHPDGVYCEKCDTDTHRCPGCGTDVPHGTVACGPCDRATCTHPDGFQGTADDLDEDGQDRVVSVCTICGAVDPEDVEPDDDPQTGPVRLGDLDEGDLFTRNGTLMRLTERESGTSVTAEVLDGPHRGRTGELKNLNEVVERATWFVNTVTREADAAMAAVESGDGWRTPADMLKLMPEDVWGIDALRLDCRTCSHPVTPLVEAFDLYGKAKTVLWVCEPAQHAGTLSCDNGGHECRPDTHTLLGNLEVGEHFIRRGTVLRVTAMPVGGSIRAVVVEGPMADREGELSNWGETVERTYCRHNFSYGDGDQYEHNGSFCDHCGTEEPVTATTTEQETKECPDVTMPQQRPGSSAARPATTAPAPDRGSPRPTKASAPAVSQKSSPVTSSAPTAKASTSGRSAAVTTDQASAAAAFLGSGRTASPAANGTDASAAAAQFLAGGSGAHGEKETKRDRFGRYLIPHPDTGKETAWTRSTTFAKSISDTYALSQWGLRMALLGATVRPDIVQRAHGKHVKADKKLLDELTADLKNAAGDKVAANLGTSMHSFTEMADRAWHSPGGPRSVLGQVPPDCQGMVATYIRLLEETGLEPVPHLVEFTTVVKQYGVAGTSDNCYKVTKPLKLKIGRAEVQLNPGEYVIGDKKTGKDLDYGWQEIVIQLATYAQGINTAGVWDRHAEAWEPDPLSRFDEPGTKVRLDAGVVIHLPVDKESEKQPAVYGVDLESGWNAAVLCERVRTWRKVRYLASPVMVSESETFVPARSTPGVTTRTNVRPPSLRDKANAVTSKSEASAVWQEAKQAGMPDAEVDELVALMRARLQKLAEPGG